jgi:photosystem II stability/assembly factor-like uncharacterized protein
MKRIILFAYFTISLFQSVAQPQWHYLPNTPIIQGRFDDVFFTDYNYGWAVMCGGEIIKTTNGGNSWSVCYSDNSTCFRSVEFADKLNGYVGTISSGMGNNKAKLLKTTDGGNTWTDIIGLINPKPLGICGMCTVDKNTSYICGTYYDSAYIAKTTDGGLNWAYVDMRTYASGLVDIQFISKDTGFVVGRSSIGSEGGIVLYTIDGGNSWSYNHKTMTTGDRCWKIQVLDKKYMYASVESSGGPYRILKSTNGGINWQEIIVLNNGSNNQMVGFINPKKGWTGGHGSPLYETLDSGNTWQTTSFGHTPNRFFRLDSTLAYCAGNSIYKYYDTLLTSIHRPQNSNANDDIHTIEVYPNPSTGNVKIKYTINRGTVLDLFILDAGNAIVERLYKGNIDKGEYTARWNCTKCTPGNYTVVLYTNEGAIIKKIVIQ